ncbi:MAG: hypothetical protein JRJ19_08330 [Deltaproteobacteria bacterium]|nr:hypothetical protein [Deltaproteobacteria bacterium]MBW1872055.1 hypothetical protein [Deltaproteobacteria bacterium]
MNNRIMPTILVAMLVAVPLLWAVAADEDSAKVKSAIRHRCILECVWLEDRCNSSKAPGCKDSIKACTAVCMDDETLKAAMAEKPPKTWGTTIKEAIEVCLPSGEQYFLRDLLCAGSKAPGYERSGSVGPRNPMPADAGFDANMLDPTYRLKKGQVDTHIIDKYEVRCEKKTHILYFDMYHCGTPKPWAAPEGFTRPPRG